METYFMKKTYRRKLVTEKDLVFLRETVNKLTIKEQAKKIKRSFSATADIRHKHGIKVSKERRKELDVKKKGEENKCWKGGWKNYRSVKIQERRLKYPEKELAIRIIAKEIRQGRIKRLPCVVCGKEKTEAHHESYDKPLDVVFLCRRHHQDVHNEKNKTKKQQEVPEK